MASSRDRTRAERTFRPTLEGMEARLALSAPGVVHLAEVTQDERQLLDGLNAALGTNLTLSEAASDAMARVPFSTRDDTDAYKARLRKAKVPFVEGGSIVVVKGSFSGDVPSAADGTAEVLRAFRRQNRAYAAHTAAGVVIDGGTLRVLTFSPAKGAKPATPAGLAGSYRVRSVDGLLGTPLGLVFGSADRKDILGDASRTLKGLTFEFGKGGAFRVTRDGSRGFFHPDGTYSVTKGRVGFSGFQDDSRGADLYTVRLSGGGTIPKSGPLKVSISMGFVQTTGAAGSTGRNYTARVSATLV